MNITLQQLEENINAIVSWKKKNTKILSFQKKCVNLLFPLLIDPSKRTAGDEYKIGFFIEGCFKDNEIAEFEYIDKELVRIAIWLRDNKDFRLPSQVTNRIAAIQKLLNEMEEYTDEEYWQKYDKKMESMFNYI